MNPVAIQIGHYSIRWYGIMAALAMLSAYYLMNRYGKRYGLSENMIDTIMIILLPTVIVGARTAYVVSMWAYFKDNLWEIVRIDQGGLGSHGAIIAVSLVGYIISRVYRIRLADVADAIAPSVPLAHVFIRIGNFLNGELYGLPTNLPWGVAFPGLAEKVHPSMLYEGFVAIFVFIASLRWAENREWAGAPILRTMLVVSVVRVLVDFTRPIEPVFMGLMLTQVLALGIAIVCASLLYFGPRIQSKDRSRSSVAA